MMKKPIINCVFFLWPRNDFFSLVGHKYHHQHFHNDHHLLGLWSGRSCLSTSSGDSRCATNPLGFYVGLPESGVRNGSIIGSTSCFFFHLFCTLNLGMDVTVGVWQITGCWDAWHASGADRGCWGCKRGVLFCGAGCGKEFRSSIPFSGENWTWNYFSIQNENLAFLSGPLQFWLTLSIWAKPIFAERWCEWRVDSIDIL